MDAAQVQWMDWKWQAKHSIVDAGKVKGGVKTAFQMKITPYYRALMEEENPNCPIRLQSVPQSEEDIRFEYKKYGIDIHDSLSEEKMSPVPNIVHRYPDRVLFTVTSNCFMYCRFCTRKRLTGALCAPKLQLEEAFYYMEQHTEIRDVLISGGDPFTLEDAELEEIIKRIRAIPHVEIIRIGTRAPVVLPMRITDKLVQILKRYQPLWINTHFNHPKEITELSAEACGKIVDAGIPLGNQSVLLRNVNNDVETMKELCTKLVKNRVRPYYLYQCDIGIGNEHFRTKIQEGIDIIEGLRYDITGFAVPQYVIDAPGGGGKTLLSPQYVIARDDEKIILRNKYGQMFVYPEVKLGSAGGV
ncbi:MAG: KamA family radical SAM protein [Lachnospiraceae bacterium]|nr:KamA family radical SAM protein [Lachnospiraceae bacterium]